MLDNLSRTKQALRWRTVLLENEYLRATFLPELGASERCELTPRRPTRLELGLGTAVTPFDIEVQAGRTILAKLPLTPGKKRPGAKPRKR